MIGEVFEISIGIHPGQRYTYSFELRREQTVHKPQARLLMEEPA